MDDDAGALGVGAGSGFWGVWGVAGGVGRGAEGVDGVPRAATDALGGMCQIGRRAGVAAARGALRGGGGALTSTTVFSSPSVTRQAISMMVSLSMSRPAAKRARQQGEAARSLQGRFEQQLSGGPWYHDNSAPPTACKKAPPGNAPVGPLLPVISRSIHTNGLGSFLRFAAAAASMALLPAALSGAVLLLLIAPLPPAVAASSTAAAATACGGSSSAVEPAAAATLGAAVAVFAATVARAATLHAVDV
jgi:hypothetical protein